MILWTASALGSDNTSGSLPFIAPMKINLVKTLVRGSKVRCGIALFVFLFSIWIALTPGAAQSKNSKRITSLRIGEASEGSRVTVVSDAALNDYEAFRRGDRFYVRIPLAYFGAGQPGFRGDGFEDVQVQKIGDSVVISFKLQPGATARVDQRSNRLDVIFSAPNKMVRTSGANTFTNRAYVPTDGIVRTKNQQTLQRRDRDAAGPMPPGSPAWPQATRERVVAERTRNSQTPLSQSVTSNPRDLSGRSYSRPAGNKGSSKSEGSPVPSKSQPPSNANRSETSTTQYKHEPSPVPTPSTSPPSYSSLATNTPASPVASQPVLKSPGVNGSQSGKSRSDIVVQWIRANRQAALLGGLMLLGLLVFLALLFRRRKKVTKEKGHATTLAQPKPSTDVVSDTSNPYSPVNPPASNVAPSGVVNDNAARPIASEPSASAVPVASTHTPRENVIRKTEEREKSVPEPALARSAAVATPINHARIPASSPAGSSTDEDQEREVFEL
jgi:hypothetical protein